MDESKPLPASTHLLPLSMAPQHQGPTLLHFSAQLEPFLTQEHTLNTP